MQRQRVAQFGRVVGHWVRDGVASEDGKIFGDLLDYRRWSGLERWPRR
jgi:hypothetical protein